MGVVEQRVRSIRRRLLLLELRERFLELILSLDGEDLEREREELEREKQRLLAEAREVA